MELTKEVEVVENYNIKLKEEDMKLLTTDLSRINVDAMSYISKEILEVFTQDQHNKANGVGIYDPQMRNVVPDVEKTQPEEPKEEQEIIGA